MELTKEAMMDVATHIANTVRLEVGIEAIRKRIKELTNEFTLTTIDRRCVGIPYEIDGLRFALEALGVSSAEERDGI